MRVDCLHGYFKFQETQPGQLSRFMSLFGLELERSGDHFTFADLVDAPTYSIAGGLYLGAPATETFEGPAWEVMRKNKLVYDFTKGLVVPRAAILTFAEIVPAGNYLVSTGMLLAGSLTDEGERVTDYAAFYLEDRANFKYSGIEYA